MDLVLFAFISNKFTKFSRIPLFLSQNNLIYFSSSFNPASIKKAIRYFAHRTRNMATASAPDLGTSHSQFRNVPSYSFGFLEVIRRRVSDTEAYLVK